MNIAIPLFVTDEEHLRSLLPNIQITVDGEVDVYSKMTPFLNLNHRRLFSQYELGFVPEESLPLDILAPLEAFMAMISAAPSLDCVLTPNGFAVVYNQYMMPTAKLGSENPMSRMIESLKSAVFELELSLIERLTSCPEWMAISPFRSADATVFRLRELSEMFRCKSAFDIHAAASGVLFCQDLLASRLLTQPFMKELVALRRSQDFPTEQHQSLLLMIQTYVSKAVIEKDSPMLEHYADQIKQFLILNHELFPSWCESHIGKALLQPALFVNNKKSSGYFF